MFENTNNDPNFHSIWWLIQFSVKLIQTFLESWLNFLKNADLNHESISKQQILWMKWWTKKKILKCKFLILYKESKRRFIIDEVIRIPNYNIIKIAFYSKFKVERKFSSFVSRNIENTSNWCSWKWIQSCSKYFLLFECEKIDETVVQTDNK